MEPEPEPVEPEPEAAGPTPVGCVTAVSPGHHVFPCEGGLTYDVVIPEDCPPAGCGLIVDMHGWTMDADQQDANTGMRARGLEHGYVVVQPTAPGALGSEWVPTWVFETHPALVFAFVTDVAAALLTDPQRAHATGFSQGGSMTWRLVCAYADFWASVAPLSANMGCPFDASDSPSVEVDVLAVFGTKDAILSFEEHGVAQLEAALAGWPLGEAQPLTKEDGLVATRYTTPTGTELQWWVHTYTSKNPLLGGHCFPGSPEVDGFPLAFGCADVGTVDIGEVVMDFFLNHPAAE